MKILVADDSRSIHLFVELSLKGTDHELAHVYDGAEAVEWIKYNEDGCDLVLMDWEMPLMQGVDAVRQLRSMGFKAPIIMITTKNDPAEIQQALEAGVSDFVMKPFTRDIILEKIEAVMGAL